MHPNKAKKIAYNGFCGTIRDWAERTGIPEGRIYDRLRRYGQMSSGLELVFAPSKLTGFGKAKFYSLGGKTMTRNAWAKELGISPGAVKHRLERDWTLEEALQTLPPLPRGITRKTMAMMKTVDGIKASLVEHCRRVGMRYTTVLGRIQRGWMVGDALKTPVARGSSSKNHISRRRRQLAALGIVI